jgi:hypothetical protein
LVLFDEVILLTSSTLARGDSVMVFLDIDFVYIARIKARITLKMRNPSLFLWPLFFSFINFFFI